MTTKVIFLFALIILTADLCAQTKDQISRIEFNSGTRTYREQIIISKDSLIVIKEDFKKDKPPLTSRTATGKDEWSGIIESLEEVELSQINDLKSPTMKRSYDGAAHGSLIITTSDGHSWKHGFDDDDPHEKFKPLMKEIRKISGKGNKKLK
jgi:hypothetical protein